ncbi:hypothetical protein K504DRAFT_529049 [Pleomassaria siparia CBS 279.74]|uniref:Heterokaryon incompatibility domain-containing protein n=1 Tax=Pleomassaria siparia CBS 279.74 TaxID=1314801 RepID=A0A6G1KPK9_9PLEO|nr:hypothetical protein K504DRAFT_529049 [Pleomassaria siparia CBS 279.74]
MESRAAFLNLDTTVSYEDTSCPACSLLPLEALLARDGTPAPVMIRLDELDMSVCVQHSSVCDLCRLLVDLDAHWSSPRCEMSMELDTTYREMCGRKKGHLKQLQDIEWQRSKSRETSRLALHVDFDSVLAKQVYTHHTHEEPLSDRSIRMIKDWISDCDSRHGACSDHPNTMPSRVVDVEALKLLDPSPPGSHQYAALSHCWGTCRDFLTTRSSNLAERKAGFSLSELPATFRDAVICNESAWDPLCDKEDWEIEGKNMADVYSNTTFTITAVDADDDAQGFLKPRQQPPFLSFDVTFHTSNHTSQELTTRIYTHRPKSVDYSRFPVLNGRAWCLQERYLNPRILCFDRHAISWECLEVRDERGRVIQKFKSMLPDIMPHRSEQGDMIHKPWLEMITHQRETNTSPEYGIWKSDLLRSLLWFPDSPRTTNLRVGAPKSPYDVDGRRSKMYIAPSWSWASCLTAVTFQATRPGQETLQLLPCVTVAEVSVSVPGKNMFGQVEDGYLVLSSPMLSFEVDEESALAHKFGWAFGTLYCPELEEECDFNGIWSRFDYPNETRSGAIFGIPICLEPPREEDEIEDGESEEEPREVTGTSDEAQGEETETGLKELTDTQEEMPLDRVNGILIMKKHGEDDVYEKIGCFDIDYIKSVEFLGMLGRKVIQRSKIV